jgi:glycosyltransferase involved in cell wall biosynthesis
LRLIYLKNKIQLIGDSEVNRPKEILFLSNRGFLPINDGHSRRSFNILKGLAENNKIYFLFLYEKPEEVSPANIEQLKKICHCVEFLPAPSKKVSAGFIFRLIKSLFSLYPYTVWRHYSNQFKKRVDELISSGKFDLVHCDNLPICYTVQFKKNIFCSITDHDVSYLKCLSIGKEARNFLLKSFLYLEAYKIKILEKNIFNKVNLGIVVSENDKIILQKLCPNGNFLVVENGVDLDIFKPSWELQEKGKLLWLGGFNHIPNKQGIYYFLEKIYPLVKLHGPNISIDIIGGGVTDELKKFSENDLSINFIGYVDDPMPFIHRAEVFVAPILSGGGTKLKVLEAMATGKAIVCSSFGCEGIEGVNGHHYIVADNPLQFAQDIINILNDNFIKESLQVNAAELVRQSYGFAYTCKKLNDYYNLLGIVERSELPRKHEA